MIMWSLQTRIEKSFSYSISYSYSNLKVPIERFTWSNKSQTPATLTHPNESVFETENVTSLNEEEKLSCEGIVSEDECLRSLKEFKNCKSPGTDGLSAEFYKLFWSEISTDMIGSFNYAFKTGTLSISQRRGIISLIPKKNKEKKPVRKSQTHLAA